MYKPKFEACKQHVFSFAFHEEFTLGVEYRMIMIMLLSFFVSAHSRLLLLDV